jgi:hypothetical protein
MKTKFAIVSAAVLAFATLPSCTPTGGIDPGIVTLAQGAAQIYLDHQQQEDERDYERFRQLQEDKRQPLTPDEPEIPETEIPGTGATEPVFQPSPFDPIDPEIY